MIAAMSHGCGPAHHHPVVGSEGIFNHNFDIGKSAAQAFYQEHKLCGTTKLAAILELTHTDDVGREKVVNGLHPTLVPYFFKPPPHQLHIFFDRHD
jgi:hypothetical protein